MEVKTIIISKIHPNGYSIDMSCLIDERIHIEIQSMRRCGTAIESNYLKNEIQLILNLAGKNERFAGWRKVWSKMSFSFNVELIPGKIVITAQEKCEV